MRKSKEFCQLLLFLNFYNVKRILSYKKNFILSGELYSVWRFLSFLKILILFGNSYLIPRFLSCLKIFILIGEFYPFQRFYILSGQYYPMRRNLSFQRIFMLRECFLLEETFSHRQAILNLLIVKHIKHAVVYVEIRRLLALQARSFQSKKQPKEV